MFIGVKIAQLKAIGDQTTAQSMRSTAGTDVEITTAQPRWWQQRRHQILAAVVLVIVLLGSWSVRGWLASAHTVARESLRIATVNRGHFVRDVSAQGTIVAAINPTVFAPAVGTISYIARAGDAVKQGQILATLDSPALRNEYEREQATLQSRNVSLEIGRAHV